MTGSNPRATKTSSAAGASSSQIRIEAGCEPIAESARERRAQQRLEVLLRALGAGALDALARLLLRVADRQQRRDRVLDQRVGARLRLEHARLGQRRARAA